MRCSPMVLLIVCVQKLPVQKTASSKYVLD